MTDLTDDELDQLEALLGRVTTPPVTQDAFADSLRNTLALTQLEHAAVNALPALLRAARRVRALEQIIEDEAGRLERSGRQATAARMLERAAALAPPAGEPKKKICCVCGVQVSENAPWEDRWSWGPDGLHCHQRCEGGFSAALAARRAPPAEKMGSK